MVIAVPSPASSHQRGRPVDHARQAPARAIALDRAIRFGFQMKVDSSTADADTAITSPATSPATGPPMSRASHHVTSTAAIPASAIRAVTASGESPPVRYGGRGEEVVVDGAVVDVADRGRRAEQRHDAVADQRAQREHVVALVGIPRAARREVGQAEERGEQEETDRDRQDQEAVAAGERSRRVTVGAGHQDLAGLAGVGRRLQGSAPQPAVRAAPGR